jgi:hypothetical protein
LKKEKITVSTIAKGSNSQTAQTMEITIGSSTYVVSGFFKSTGKTVSEKLYNIMEKEVERRMHGAL